MVELLVVIAVIAIIAAIAIPNIAGITGAANASKNQRNAQNIASVYNSAVAAGYVNTAVTTDTQAADALIVGVTVAGASFRVDGLNNTERDAALQYLSYNTTNGTVIYSTTATP